jgi:56kDa selenium binding protein (SBP56)
MMAWQNTPTNVCFGIEECWACPDGSALGDKDGSGKGGYVALDQDFNVTGTWTEVRALCVCAGITPATRAAVRATLDGFVTPYSGWLGGA